MDLRRARGVFDLLVAGIRAGEAQVLADRGVEQIRFLGDEPDRGGERLAASGRGCRRRRSTRSRAGAHTVAPPGRRAWSCPSPSPRRARCACRLGSPPRCPPASRARRGRSETTHPPGARRRAPRSACVRPGRSSMSTGRSRYSKMRPNSASEVCTSRPDRQQLLHREQQPRLQRRERDDGADRDHVARRGRSSSRQNQ